MVTAFEVRRDDFRQVRARLGRPEPLGVAQARLSIEAFALSSNNVTYGLFGEAMSYFSAFPTEAGWGRIPAWGFAEVVESTHEQVAVGTRVYGFVPMASEVVVSPVEVRSRSFLDGADPRSALARPYRLYTEASSQPGYEPDREPQLMMLWPLFFTAFLVHDLLDEEGAAGGGTVVVTSASSKTALGVAFLLAERHAARVVAVTSREHVPFCAEVGCYDAVVTYDDVESLEVSPSVLVDLSGRADARNRIHRHLASLLTSTHLVGATHWDELGGAPEGLPGPAPRFFFAPDRIALRSQAWGGDVLASRVGEAWSRFVTWTDDWLEVRRVVDPTGLEAAYLGLVQGRSQPEVGYIATLVDSA